MSEHKPGRPARAAQPSDAHVVVRVTRQEKQQVRELARREGETSSSFLRGLIADRLEAGDG